MSEIEKMVEFYVEMLRGRSTVQAENAFHSLIEMGKSAKAALIRSFYHETDPVVKQMIVHIVWQNGTSEVAPFLVKAIECADDRIWKEALDGLVSISSREKREWLEKALDAAQMDADITKYEYIREAIDGN